MQVPEGVAPDKMRQRDDQVEAYREGKGGQTQEEGRESEERPKT